MSQYTTGEMAKLCKVSVRTVQYYDSRQILRPDSLSEGGRRLYSEENLKKLQLICFLRSMDLSIDQIARVLSEENAKEVISLLLEEQGKLLKQEIEDRRDKLGLVEAMARSIQSSGHSGEADFSIETINDIAFTMKNRQKLRKVHTKMMIAGIMMDLIEIGTLVLGIWKGIWLPFVIGLMIIIPMVVWIVTSYYEQTVYICPKCHQVFKPGFREFFFSRHTLTMRKLTCTACGYKGFCVETCNETEKQ
ncbi:MAG: MerR family transcriptional regulator [Lachnospiraceae bacterium]|nr:MerR family transcriptional regulator [Lachnospiraceae bacterium]